MLTCCILVLILVQTGMVHCQRYGIMQTPCLKLYPTLTSKPHHSDSFGVKVTDRLRQVSMQYASLCTTHMAKGQPQCNGAQACTTPDQTQHEAHHNLYWSADGGLRVADRVLCDHEVVSCSKPALNKLTLFAFKGPFRHRSSWPLKPDMELMTDKANVALCLAAKASCFCDG